LDEKRLVGLYQDTVPEASPPLEPLPRSTGSKRNLGVFTAFLVVALCSAYFAWKAYPTPERTTSGFVKIHALKNSDEAFSGTGQPIALKGTTGASSISSSLGKRARLGIASILSDAFSIDTSEMGDNILSAAESGSTATGGPLLLKLRARETTWVKIFMDDEKAMEYTFHSGDQREFRAKRGFELIVGNAGGVDIEFKGRKVQKLGDSGQVIQLKLPENYQKKGSRD
jgi:hypothetical protein